MLFDYISYIDVIHQENWGWKILNIMKLHHKAEIYNILQMRFFFWLLFSFFPLYFFPDGLWYLLELFFCIFFELKKKKNVLVGLFHQLKLN